MRTNNLRRATLGWAALLMGFSGLQAGAQTAAGGDLLLQCRFAGTAVLFANTNAAKLKRMATMAPAEELRAEAAAKLARAGAQWLQQRRAEGFPAGAQAILQSFAGDLSLNGFHLEARGAAGASAEWALAVVLPPDRAAFWESEWGRLAAGAAKPPNPQDWEARASGGPQWVRFTRTGGLVVVGGGPNKPVLQPRLVQEFKTGACQAPALSPFWLEATADLKRLGWLPASFSGLAWPLTHLTVSNKADVVRWNLQMLFAEPHGWRAEPWQIPAKLMFDPLVSFTAAQGVGPVWKEVLTLAGLPVQPAPAHYYGWAQAQTPFQTYFATPWNGGSNQLRSWVPPLQHLIGSLPPSGAGQIGWATNRGHVAWTQLPYLAPTLSTAQTGGRDYLVGTLFPTLRTRNPAPQELLSQVASRTNLVYYDWELAQERSIQWRQLFQLFEMIDRKPFTGSNYASHRWLTQAAPLLDNCVTEAVASSPRQITVQRKSQTGFTGFELVWLTHWIESEAFPKWGITKPARAPKAAAAPAPKTPAQRPPAGGAKK